MDAKKITAVIEMYEHQLQKARIPRQRMDPTRHFGSLSTDELLAHAHYLCGGVKKYVQEATTSSNWRKVGSHLTAVQMCLSFAGLYTLNDLMNHNRSRIEDS